MSANRWGRNALNCKCLKFLFRCILQVLCLGPATLMCRVCISNCCGKCPPFFDTSCCSSFFVRVFSTAASGKYSILSEVHCIYRLLRPLYKPEQETQSPDGFSVLVFNTWHCASVNGCCTVPHQCNAPYTGASLYRKASAH